ncbi:MAG: glycosyltransferase family 2 protein [Candidatus Rhabdochlamydia sp.]
MDQKNKKLQLPTFIMPHYCDKEIYIHCMKQAVEGIQKQSDNEFNLLIIDDNSPQSFAKDLLKKMRKEDSRIHIIFLHKNHGAGYCRNMGIKWAEKHEAPFVLFNDSDDISHPKRLEVTKGIFHDGGFGLLYSTYIPIDEEGKRWDIDKLPSDICEALELHKNSPPQGENAWVETALKYGYVNLTSSTSIATKLAIKYLSPITRVSEDTHTWYRIMASTDKVIYNNSIPSMYRMPKNSEMGIAAKDRYGKNYYNEKIKIDLNGFRKAIEIAKNRNKIKPEMEDALIYLFCKRLSDELSRHGFDRYLSIEKEVYATSIEKQ